jgi:hypothetical protein
MNRQKLRLALGTTEVEAESSTMGSINATQGHTRSAIPWSTSPVLHRWAGRRELLQYDRRAACLRKADVFMTQAASIPQLVEFRPRCLRRAYYSSLLAKI